MAVTANTPDESFSAEDVFEEAASARAVSGESFVVNVDGFAGPLDLLLALARTQKVDLAKISILALVEQYLAFMTQARVLKIELAADYLVMAAWLAYLKSRLLLPRTEEPEGPTGDELAARLAFQLRRLDAMREAAAHLMARPRLGRDVFARGAPERLKVLKRVRYVDALVDLLKAYGEIAGRARPTTYEVRRVPVLSLEEARGRLERLVGRLPDWVGLQGFLVGALNGEGGAETRRSRLASTFAATLELVKDGRLELRQLKPFGIVYVRARKGDGEAGEPRNGANDA